MQPRIALPALLTLCALGATADHAAAQWNMQPNYWGSPGIRTGRPSPGCGIGASAYYLMPFFDNNTAFITVNAGETTQTTTDFEWDFQPAGAVWFGLVNEYGSGVRGRFFYFDNDSKTLNAVGTNQTITAPPALDQPGGAGFVSPGVIGTVDGGDRLTFDSGLQINTGDIEFTYEWSSGPLGVLFSGGGRYQRIAQSYRALLLNTINAPLETEIQRLNSDSEFNGGGPTAALQGRWEAGGGWAIFGMVRGALLVGELSRDTSFEQLVTLDLPLRTQTSSSATKLLPVSELELGLEYCWGGPYSNCVLRGAIVNQTYFGAGTAATDEGNLSLFGAQLSIGFSY